MRATCTMTAAMLFAFQAALAAPPGKEKRHAYPVSPRMTRNVIVIEARNRTGGALSTLAPSVASKPDWVTVKEVSVDRQSLPADSTLEVRVVFDVAATVKVGDRGTIDIRLRAAGKEVHDHAIDLIGALPESYELARNYPNPFNPATNVEFALPSDSHVAITVFDVLGRKVITLLDEVRPAGYYAQRWEGRNSSGSRVASGVYFLRMEATSVSGGKSFSAARKMMMLK